MKRLRTAMLVLVAMLPTWATVGAQTPIPNYAYLRDSSGQVFVVSGGQRLAVPIYPATDEQINAIPWPGTWLVPRADGTGYDTGGRPEWAVSPVAAPPPPAATGATVTLNGDGQQNTRPFDLAGGSYTVRWEGRMIGQSGGNLIVTLKRVDGQGFGESIVNLILGREKPAASGETQVYGVKPGPHYLDVLAPGPWSVTFTPL